MKSTLAAIQAGLVKGLSHITGGGFLENIPRILPRGMAAHIDTGTWQLPGVFSWLQQQGNIQTKEMARTFNCGIGMVAIVAEADEREAAKILQDEGETVIRIGRIEASDGLALCRVSGKAGTWGSETAWSATTGED